MTALLEKITVWTFFFTVIAIVIGLGYATYHLARDTATKSDLAKVEIKIDKLESKE